MINDINIIKEDILHGELKGGIKYNQNFAVEEIPFLNYYRMYLSDLKEKIIIKKEAAGFVNKLIY